MRDHLANFQDSLGNFGKSLTCIVETQAGHTNALNLLQRTQQQTLDHLKKIHESELEAKLAEQAAGLEKKHTAALEKLKVEHRTELAKWQQANDQYHASWLVLGILCFCYFSYGL